MKIDQIQSRILEVRDVKVMLDFDLASLYEVPTKSLNLAVKRNTLRFPEDFMFQLTPREWQIIKNERNAFLRFQNETLETRGRHSKYLPFAFTEQGLA